MKKKLKGLLALWLSLAMLMSSAQAFASSWYVYNGDVPAEDAGRNGLWDNTTEFAGFDESKPLNEQEYPVTFGKAGFIHSGWSLWGYDAASGILNSGPIKKALTDGLTEDEKGFRNMLIEPTYLKYRISEQPSAENGYTVTAQDVGGTPESPEWKTADNVYYQWYEANITEQIFTVVDDEEQVRKSRAVFYNTETDGGNEISSTCWTGTYSNGIWSSSGKEIDIEIPVQSGDVIKAEFISGTFSGTVKEYGCEEYTYENGIYSYTVCDDLDNIHNIHIKSENETDTEFTVKITVTRTLSVKTPLDGANSASLTNGETGKTYICDVTFDPSGDSEVFSTDPVTVIHSHDMSAECGHDNDVTFDSAITLDTDGKLYVNGTEITAQSDGFGNNSYSLGDGNFYLASDVEFSSGKNYLKLSGNVNLCLNGHTTNATINIDKKDNVGGVLNMCDCDEKKLGTIDAANNSGDIMNNKDGVQIENAASESVKNTFNMYGGNIYGAYRGVVALAEGNFNMYGGKVTGGSTALFTWCPTHLYGGEISGNETGIMVCSPVYLHSGAVIKNNTVDLEWYASSANTVTIDGYTPANGYKLTVDCENMTEPFDITEAANADYSGYFEESNDIKAGGLWKIKNSGEGANQVVQLTDAENLSITKGGVISYYATLERAFEAAADGDTIKAEKDYADMDSYTGVSEGETITIDLNGKHISGGNNYPIIEVSNGSLTIKGNGSMDGIIYNDESGNGHITIENGTYEVLQLYSTENVVVKDGTFKGISNTDDDAADYWGSGILYLAEATDSDIVKEQLLSILPDGKGFNKDIKTTATDEHSGCNSAAYFDGEVKVLDITPSPGPSTEPSAQPSAEPSTEPSVQPSVEPSAEPSVQPSAEPSAEPSARPSANPTANPTRKPIADSQSSSSSRVKSTPKPTSTPDVTTEPTTAPPETSKPSDSGSQNQHKAYIMGYEGKFNPNGIITRAETAAMLARLIDVFDENEVYTPTFGDVDSSLWYYKSIGFAESQNIITGYKDGSFKPEDGITRAEFASMIAKFAELDTENADIPFADAKGHWAADKIAACYTAGYIKGYTDNTFKPDNYITRAEAVTMINRVLDRNDIKDFTNPFNDISESHWAYKDIMEAAITHNIE